ncbi:MAG: tetratricopeptide repeat protein [Microcystaceae cyanobacterium]
MNQSQSKLINLLFFATLILGLETPLQAQIARIDSITPKTGRVLLKREDSTDFIPFAPGASINEGDQIFPAQGVRVRVVCPDRTNKPVSAGVPSGIKTICPIWEVRIVKAPQPPGTLGGINLSIPFVMSPRHSLLLSNTPILRWNAVSGATQYAVQLMSPKDTVWKGQVKGDQIVYPGNPPLEPGVSYSLEVQANTGQSSKPDGASNIAFIVLRPTEAQSVQAEASQITQQGLSSLVTALLLADFYSNYVLPAPTLEAYRLTLEAARSYNLTAEALATLETLTKRGENSPLVYRLLGDLYWQSGLAHLTTQNYLKAIELAKSPEYLEEKTLAQFGLGEVYAATNDLKQAIFWYEQAKMGYVDLGDALRADFLNRRLKTLKSR